MQNHFHATMKFTHGEIKIEGTLIFVIATIAENEKRDGFVLTHKSDELHAALKAAEGNRDSAKIKIDDIKIGQVVAEMHLHQTNWGLLKGWKTITANLPFEIDEAAFLGIYGSLPVVDERSTSVVENKYARVVSFTEDFQGNVSSVLVIYSYDHRYYMTTLVDPEWDKKL